MRPRISIRGFVRPSVRYSYLQNPAYPSPITHQPPLIIFRCVLASLEFRHFGHCVDFAPIPPTTKIQFFFKLIPLHFTLKTYESFATDLNFYHPINVMKIFYRLLVGICLLVF